MRFISEDPAGFVDGPNLYAYVGGNPIGYVDPNGLWTVDVELYLGGGGVSISYAKGTLEVLGRLGVGYGGGATFDLDGVPSPHAESTGSGYIARTRFNGSLGLGAGGPLSAGVSATGTTGNAVTTPVGGNFLGSNGGGVLEPSRAAGFRFGGSVSVELGSYTNGLFGTSSAQCP